MTNSMIAKILSKVSKQPKEYSLGFKRLTSLPLITRKSVILDCVLNGESNTNSMKDYLNGLSEQEFIVWLRVNK